MTVYMIKICLVIYNYKTKNKFNVQMLQKQNHNPNQFCFHNAKINKQLYLENSSPVKKTLCNRHRKTVGRYFCNECLTYNLCERCFDDHMDHSIDEFEDFQEAKEATRETLLLEVEQTLNRLKGRENELKNQVEEIGLIKEKIRQQANDIIDCLRAQFDQLQRKLAEKMQSQFDRYQKELDTFYREYNSVNDYLREQLLQIIDGEINLTDFNREKISKDIDAGLMPNFGKIKQVMQKCKRYLKNVKNSAESLQKCIKYFSSEEEKSQHKFQKYDKFLKERSNNESEYSSPLLRNLGMLESSSDLTFLKSKLKN